MSTANWAKHLIDMLKEKCCTKQELQKLSEEDSSKPSHGADANRKKCERFIVKFKSLGLVEERGDKYCWYQYLNDFKDQETLSSKLLHSQKLIHALRRVGGLSLPSYVTQETDKLESIEEAAIHDECVEDHLRAYPKIWQLLEKYSRAMLEAEQDSNRFKASLKERLEKEVGEKTVNVDKGVNLDSFVGSNIPSLIHSHIARERPIRIDMKENEEIWDVGSLIAKGRRLFGIIRNFIEQETGDENNASIVKRTEQTEKEAFDVQRELQHEIRMLVERVESGEPLLGGCDTCPKVYFQHAQADQ